MRQVGDTLVWLGLIAVVVAVLYFTPVFASYFSSREREALRAGRGGVAWQAVEEPEEAPVEFVR
jgi:hypothetical protein